MNPLRYSYSEPVPKPTDAFDRRAGWRLLERELREARIAASYREAYATPLTEDERVTLDAALGLDGPPVGPLAMTR